MKISNIINLWACSSVKFDSLDSVISGLYYKPIMIVNDNSGIVKKLETSLIDDARVVIYDCHMFIVQATSHFVGSKPACYHRKRDMVEEIVGIVKSGGWIKAK